MFLDRLNEALGINPLEQLENILYKAYGDDPILTDLIAFAGTSSPTDPSAKHTSSVAQNEIRAGRRLVSQIWSDDIDEEITLPNKVYGKSILIAKTDDLLDITKFEGPEAHIIRGLAFGYDPQSILQYYEGKKRRAGAADELRDLGVKLSMDINGGYASGPGNAIIEPNDLEEALELISQKYKIKSISRWCPDCNDYVDNDDRHQCSECENLIKDRRDLPANKRPWYSIEFG